MTYNMIINVPQIPYGTRLVLGSEVPDESCWRLNSDEDGWVYCKHCGASEVVCIPIDPGECWEIVPVGSTTRLGDQILNSLGWYAVEGNFTVRESHGVVRRRKQVSEPWTIAAEIKRHEEKTGKLLSWDNPLKLSQRDGNLCLVCKDISAFLPSTLYPIHGYGSGGEMVSWTAFGARYNGSKLEVDIVGPWEDK
jgi:hypothetical protein